MDEQIQTEKTAPRRRGRAAELVLPGVVFLFLLFLQVCVFFRFENKKPLTGVTPAAKPIFTAEGVVNGSWQRGWGDWLNDNFYGYPFTVRCHNQLQYSLFRDGNGDGVLGGNYIIQSKAGAYNYATGGLFSESQENIDAYVEKVSQLQMELEKYGKDFIYILTPAKVETYSDKLPWYEELIAERYADRGGQTNRDKMIAAFEKYGVNYYDMSQDINRMRDEVDFEVFPKTGFHWTLTAAATELGQAMDGLRALAPHIDFPDLTVTGLNDEEYHTDKDVYNNQNIFAGVLSDEYHSPVIEYSHRSQNKVFMYGSSMSVALFYALTTGENGRAFDDLLFQMYFTAKHLCNEDREEVLWYKATDTPDTLQVMENIRDRDLIIMEHPCLSSILDTHVKFLDYVLENMEGGLYYEPGGELADVTDGTWYADLTGVFGLEDFGRWTKDDPTVTVYGDRLYNAGRDAVLRFTAGSYHTGHAVKVRVNGETVETVQVPTGRADFAVTIPAELLRDDANTVELLIEDDLYSPKELGESEEVRHLGLSLISMTLEVSG